MDRWDRKPEVPSRAAGGAGAGGEGGGEGGQLGEAGVKVSMQNRLWDLHRYNPGTKRPATIRLGKVFSTRDKAMIPSTTKGTRHHGIAPCIAFRGVHDGVYTALWSAAPLTLSIVWSYNPIVDTWPKALQLVRIVERPSQFDSCQMLHSWRSK